MHKKVCDPRKVGDHCFEGYYKQSYWVIEHDEHDPDPWLVEWEDGRQTRMSRYWNPDGGDRIVKRSRPDKVVTQISLLDV
jgi:hypothetical protein